MKTIVGIQFKGGGRVYYFDPLNFNFKRGDYAIVETIRGLELGYVLIGNRTIDDDELEHELKPVIRIATEKDLKQEQKNNEQAKISFEIFKKYVKEFNLAMKPLYCEYTIDSSKVIFYYSAEERIDFRDLLKVLAPEFKIRVELRQIGTREAARVIGGIGSCGRELCCKTHLANFDFVTMKMAKEQGMALNTNKISGICDKLMCCIAYEHELYQNLKKELPSIGQMVKTPTCEACKVVSVDYIKKLIKTNENESGVLSVHKAEDVSLFETKEEQKKAPEKVEIKKEEEKIVVEETITSVSNLKPNTNKVKQHNYHSKKKQGTTNAKAKNRNSQ